MSSWLVHSLVNPLMIDLNDAHLAKFKFFAINTLLLMQIQIVGSSQLPHTRFCASPATECIEIGLVIISLTQAI